MLTQDAKSVVFRYLSDLNTPKALAVYIIAKAEAWDQLPAIGIDPTHHYHDTVSGANKFARDFQARELLRKCSDLPEPDTMPAVPLMDRLAILLKKRGVRQVSRTLGKGLKERAAREGFLESEYLNVKTNARLDPWFRGYPRQLEPQAAARMAEYFGRVQKEIRDVLGPVPNHLPQWRFGMGTFVGWNEERAVTIGDKLTTSISHTRRVKDIFLHGLPMAWSRVFDDGSTMFQEVTRKEKFGVVPKDFMSDRTIGIQPLANLCVQKSIGDHIRARLLEVACIDLNNGQHLHQRKARESSISNGDATVDIKNSSNSLAYNAVRFAFLKAPGWFELMSDSRVQYTSFIGGRSLRLAMFSAMGNGFTFELQTLMFWAFARALGVERPLVYGDDIIVPRDVVPALKAVLAYFGFRTNGSKTFDCGPFRESCGGNFFLGWALKPARIKEFPRAYHEWFSLHNSLYRSSATIGKVATRRARLACLFALPPNLRKLGGPIILGDTVLHGEPLDVTDKAPRWHPPLEFCHQTRHIRTYAACYHKHAFARYGGSGVQMAMALYGVPSDGVGYRNNVVGYRIRIQPYSSSYNPERGYE